MFCTWNERKWNQKGYFAVCACVWASASHSLEEEENGRERKKNPPQNLDKSCRVLLKEGKEKTEWSERETKPLLYVHSPMVTSCLAAFKFVQGQSGTRYNPPASPVQHQRHSGRNILPPHLNTKYHQCGTVKPILLSSLSLSPPPLLRIANAPQESDVGGVAERRQKETNRQMDALEAERVLARVGKRWATKGDKTQGKRNEWVKGDGTLFPLLPHPAHWRGGPRREPRLIGSFGLEKWISPPPKNLFPSKPNDKWAIDLLFTIQGAQCPPQRAWWTS